jgi:ABC-type nitrate/sulfonate/bicarbonate transport system substrate-binding protein
MGVKGCTTGALVLVGMGMLAPLAAQQLPAPIKVSYQPAVYWALPFFVATQQGFWKQAGLAPEFSTFPAGAPQVAAAQAKSWDVGGIGSVPAVLGAARFGLLTIGITNDESKANALMVRGERYQAVNKDPALIRGEKILLTSNSTGDYAVQSCLKMWGIAKSEVQLVNLGQAQIISALISNNGDFAGVWAPNIYTLAEKGGAKVLCSGYDAGAIVPGALIVRADFAKERPELVAKYLAVYLHAWAWIKAHTAQARAMMERFYADGGVEISQQGIDAEFADRPVFTLAQQLGNMDRSSGPSKVDGWFGNIAVFMQSTGTITDAPAAPSFIDDAFLKRVAADPALRAMATSSD